MSRIRLDRKSETSAFAWFMECDRCGYRDATPYPGRSCQPPLYRFHLLGWFIGDLSDRCPGCFDTAPDPARRPYFTAARLDGMREAAESGADPRRLLEGLTDAEIGTLLTPVPAEGGVR